MPGTSPMPAAIAARDASAQPAVVSWSVSATTSRPGGRSGRHHVGRRLRAVGNIGVGMQVDHHRPTI